VFKGAKMFSSEKDFALGKTYFKTLTIREKGNTNVIERRRVKNDLKKYFNLMSSRRPIC
jgi:RecB family endonuclease NucS